MTEYKSSRDYDEIGFWTLFIHDIKTGYYKIAARRIKWYFKRLYEKYVTKEIQK